MLLPVTAPFAILLGALCVRLGLEIALVRRSLGRGPRTGRGSLLVFGISWGVAASASLGALRLTQSVEPGFVAALVAMLVCHQLRLATARLKLGEAYDTGLEPRGALATTGAYSLVRHPVYLFYALEIFCLSLCAPTAAGLGATLANLVATVVRIPAEERFLASRFAASWDGFCQKTRWRLLPGIW